MDRTGALPKGLPYGWRGVNVNDSTGRRGLIAAAAAAAALLCAPAAQAAIPTIPDGNGGTIPCTVQTGADAGERHCAGIFTSFDGAPIDVNVGFPAEPGSGPDGHFPVIGVFHGWGGSKLGLSDDLQEWLDDGYAVFSMSDRGWGESCGATAVNRPQPICTTAGYNHLMDTRYEVRDAQEVFAALADQAATGGAGQGLIDPAKIGVSGGSYGGGLSMALAALRNRVMLPDGSLTAWTSEGGKPMQIAAAQPDIPWSDLSYSLLPNGHTLDYVADAPYLKRGRIGVMKQSFVTGLYGTGVASSNYALPGGSPDINAWYALLNGGEPYDGTPAVTDIVDEVTTYHSSYYIDDSIAPAPLLISNGWTDDLFPPDEAIRFYNRTRSRHPGSPVSLIFSDHGHQRGQNKAPDAEFRNDRRHAWMDHYVKGTGPAPIQGVETLTQACGGPSGGATGPFDDAGADQPYSAPTWRALAPGEIRLTDAAQKAIAPTVTDPAPGQAYDPIAGGGACATASGADQAGAASYRLPEAPAGGYTLMGSPTIVAEIDSVGPNSQVAARLVDVAPSGDATLVARGLYRPEVTTGDPTLQVFQLHPNGWRFEPGHVAKLELLAADPPYGKASNGQAPVTVSELELRLPVLEAPNGGLIGGPAPKVLPEGYELAADYQTAAGGQPTGNTTKPRSKCKRKAKRKGKGQTKRKGKRRAKKRCKRKGKRKRKSRR